MTNLEIMPLVATEETKNVLTTSLLRILHSPYHLLWHKLVTYTQTHHSPLNLSSTSVVTPQLAHLTFASHQIQHHHMSVHTQPLEQTLTLLVLHLHQNPCTLKTSSISSLPMQTTISSDTNVENLDECTNHRPLHLHLFMEILYSENSTTKTWFLFPSQLTHTAALDPCYKLFLRRPSIHPRNHGEQHIPTQNTIVPMQI